jgi:NAD+ kinase
MFLSESKNLLSCIQSKLHIKMKAAIFYNPQTNPKNKLFAEEIRQSLAERAVKAWINPPAKDFPKIDLAFSVGGDGTVLHTANLLAGRKIPLLGINFGHRGHLCETDKEGWQRALSRIVAGDFRVEEKSRIQAKITKRQNTIRTLEGLNEISIGGINRTVHLGVEIRTKDTCLKIEVQGDGLLVATRTGSTAYNLNAGGPMLLLEALSVVANNAFFTSQDLLPITHSLVLPSDALVRVRDISGKSANRPFAIADGQESFKLAAGDTVTICKAHTTSLFIRF